MTLSRFAALSSLLVAALVGGGPAGAAPFAGTLGISIGFLGAFASAPFTGAGSGTSAATHVTVPGGTFAGTVTVPVTYNPPLTAIQLKVAGNGGGSFAGDPLAGPMPVLGTAVVKGYIAGPFTLVAVPLFTAHDPGSAAGANGLGVGGSQLLAPATNPLVYLNAFHTEWTEGMKTLTGLQYTYVYHLPAGKAASHGVYYYYLNGTAMYTGTDSRTPGGLGQVTLVSPTKVVTNLTGGLEIFLIVGTLTLSFVPEPGTLLLLGSGVVALAALGRRRTARA